MLPVRNVTDKITAHYGTKDPVLWKVVEEIRRAFQEFANALDKPTFVPARQGDRGAPGASGVPSQHVFDGSIPVNINGAFLTAADGSLVTMKNDAGTLRFRNFPPSASTLGINGTEIWLADEERYDEAESDQIYRGLSVRGSVIPRFSGAAGVPQEAITNGSFESGTYNSRTGTHPTGWILKDDGSMGLVSPGYGGTGSALFISVGSGGQAKTRIAGADFTVPGTSPSGGTDTCVGDAGGPGITNGSHTVIELLKNTVYTLTFRMRLVGGAASTRIFSFGVYAHENNTPYGTCNGTSGYSLSGDSLTGATSGTFNTWDTSRNTEARFKDVPNDSVYRLYTATIDTTGVGTDAGSGDSFFASIFFASALSGTGQWEIDDVSLLIPGDTPFPVDTPLTIYGQSFDQLEFVPSIPQDDGVFTFGGVVGLGVAPTLRPVTSATAALTLTAMRGAVFGFHYDGTDDLGTLTADDVTSAYFETPEFGSDPLAAVFDGSVAFRSGNSIRLYEPSGSNFTSIRATTQSADVTMVLPAAQGGAGTVLTNDGAGNLSWASAGSGGGGGYPEALGFGGI